MLFPMTTAAAEALLFRNHLAFAALRDGRGNHSLAGELLKNVYMSVFLTEAWTRKSSMKPYVAAEQAIKACFVGAETGGEWRLDKKCCARVEAFVRIYDVQPASLPLAHIERAKARLAQLFGGKKLLDLAPTFEAMPEDAVK